MLKCYWIFHYLNFNLQCNRGRGNTVIPRAKNHSHKKDSQIKDRDIGLQQRRCVTNTRFIPSFRESGQEDRQRSEGKKCGQFDHNSCHLNDENCYIDH